MTDLFEFLQQEGINGDLLKRAADFRREFPLTEADASRVPKPRFLYYGKDVWEKALTAILSGENILLCGTKATGKNVLAENLSALLSRPEWDISFYLNTDAATLIGTDTFRDGKVTFRRGPIYQCAEHGGFGILDEINMAKNESLAVLHATLDFRRIIDVPGYERITLSPCTRFIATMNYGYAGTRELNEALASRFVVINMPVISKENLTRLLLSQYPELKGTYAEQFASLFQDLRQKCESSEISSKALDLRGLMAAVTLTRNGLTVGQALEISMVNKCFDEFERQLVSDLIASRIDGSLTGSELFQ